MSKVNNASQLPKVFYGLHFAEGVAEYRPAGREPYRVFINETVAKQMDPTFAGCPVYVKHVDGVDLKDIQNADGYVTESFFNKADGRHWCKFLAVSDAAHDAIAKGWSLSNAYLVKEEGEAGHWHGVNYLKEVKNAVYEHLAIVPNPRYTEAKILTPEQFKAYNSDKEAELVRLANSQGEEPVLKFFKREKVENSVDYASLMVLLPNSKKEVTIEQLVNEADERIVKNMEGYASPKHMVNLGDCEMSVDALSNEWKSMKKANADREAAEAKAMEMKEKEGKENLENEDKEEKKSEKDSDKAKKDEKDEEKSDFQNGFEFAGPVSAKEKEYLRNHFETLKGAPAKDKASVQNEIVLRGAELGKSRYGEV